MFRLFHLSTINLNLSLPLPGSHTLKLVVKVVDCGGGSGHGCLPSNCKGSSRATTRGRVKPLSLP